MELRYIPDYEVMLRIYIINRSITMAPIRLKVAHVL